MKTMILATLLSVMPAAAESQEPLPNITVNLRADCIASEAADEILFSEGYELSLTGPASAAAVVGQNIIIVEGSMEFWVNTENFDFIITKSDGEYTCRIMEGNLHETPEEEAL